MGEEVAEAEPVFTHQHGNGEIYRAESVEAARELCRALADMTLEEAGILLELQAIGNEKLAEDAKDPVAEKPVKIEKAEKETLKAEPTKETHQKQEKEIAKPDKNVEHPHITQLPQTETPEPKEPAKKETAPTLPIIQVEKPEARLPDETVHQAKETSDARHLQYQEATPTQPEPSTQQAPVELSEHPRPTQAIAPEAVHIESVLSDPVEQTPVTLPEPEVSLYQDKAGVEPEQPVPVEVAEPELEVADSILDFDTPDDLPVLQESDEALVSEFTEATAAEIPVPSPTAVEDQEALVESVTLETEADVPIADELLIDNEQQHPALDMAAVGLEAIEPAPFVAPEVAEQQETTTVLPVHETEPQPTAVETAQQEILENLAQALTALEPEAAIVTHDLLDNAVEHIQRIKQPGESPESIHASESKAVELLAEIFERVGLTYSHEVIEQFVHRATVAKTSELNTAAWDEKLPNYALSSYGTHEGLMYLLRTSKPLAKIKDTVHTALGRLVLISPSLRKAGKGGAALELTLAPS
ncbi:MAG TPA: hypothetical protein VK694_00485 [Verrucomicrobiae bacterium]|nr:hypothetical protein [Verrucomicrobiae bacterium]